MHKYKTDQENYSKLQLHFWHTESVQQFLYSHKMYKSNSIHLYNDFTVRSCAKNCFCLTINLILIITRLSDLR